MPSGSARAGSALSLLVGGARPDHSIDLSLRGRRGAATGPRPGPIAAICCQARERACRAAGCSGTLSSTASAADRICGHFPSESAAYSASTLGAAPFLAVLELGLGRSDRLLGGSRSRTGCQPLSPVKLLLGPAKLAAPTFGQRRLPGLGDLARPPQGRPADLVPRQLFDSLQGPRRLAGIQVNTYLVGHPVSQVQPSRGQRVGGRADPLGQVQVFDRAGQVVNDAAARGPGDQVQSQPAAELDRMMVIRHVGPIRQGIGLFKPADPCGFLGLPQDDVPMSQHGFSPCFQSFQIAPGGLAGRNPGSGLL